MDQGINLTSPRSMMTTLLDEVRNSLVQLFEVNKIPIDTLRRQNKDNTGEVSNDNFDLSDLLYFFWTDWNAIKDKVFTCNQTNGYGAPFRSYISLLITARNDWAHNNYTYNYEDVLHNCFVAQRFFGSARRKVNISIVDQIIETCLQEISGRYTKVTVEPAIEVTGDYATLNSHDESSAVLDKSHEVIITGSTENSAGGEKKSDVDEPVGVKKGQDGEGTRISITKEEMKEILSDLLTEFRENLVAENHSTDYSVEEELEQEESDDFEGVTEEAQGVLVHSLVHQDEVETHEEQEDLETIEILEASDDLEDLGVDDEYSIDEFKKLEASKALDLLQSWIDNKDYSKFNELMGFKSPPVVRPGTFPHTLCIAAEGPVWGSWGDFKLKLVEENLLEVFLFALSGFIPDDMKGEWEGTELICIPSKEKARVQFGRNKARMLCASMDRISKWLEKYY